LGAAVTKDKMHGLVDFVERLLAWQRAGATATTTTKTSGSLLSTLNHISLVLTGEQVHNQAPSDIQMPVNMALMYHSFTPT